MIGDKLKELWDFLQPFMQLIWDNREAIIEYTKVLVPVLGVLGGLAAIIGSLIGLFTWLLSPIGLVTGAIVLGSIAITNMIIATRDLHNMIMELGGYFQVFKNIVSYVLGNIPTMFKNAFFGIPAMIMGILFGIDLWSVGRNMINSLISGFTSRIGSLRSIARGALTSVAGLPRFGGRATGGSAVPGRAYSFNEVKPEVIIPNVQSQVYSVDSIVRGIANHMGGGTAGGGMTLVVEGNVYGDMAFKKMMKDVMTEEYERTRTR
jgi:hypothetical protein